MGSVCLLSDGGVSCVTHYSFAFVNSVGFLAPPHSQPRALRHTTVVVIHIPCVLYCPTSCPYIDPYAERMPRADCSSNTIRDSISRVAPALRGPRFAPALRHARRPCALTRGRPTKLSRAGSTRARSSRSPPRTRGVRFHAWRPAPRQPVTLLSAQWQRRPAAGPDSCCVPCQCHRACIACASLAHAQRHEHLAVGSQDHGSKVPYCKDQSGEALARRAKYAQCVRPPLPQ